MDVLKSAINKTPKKPEEVQYKDLGPNFKKSFLKLFDDEEKTKEGNVKAEDEVDRWDKMKTAGKVFFNKLKDIFN